MKKMTWGLVAVMMCVLLAVPAWSEEAVVAPDNVIEILPDDAASNAEQPPAEQQPAEQQPAQQPAEQQPAEQQPAEQQPTEQPAAQQPTEQQPAEQQPVQPEQTAGNEVYDYGTGEAEWSNETFGDWTGDNDDGAAAEAAAQDTTAETEASEQTAVTGEEPFSLTGSMFGFDGIFDPASASSEQVDLTEGEWDINDAQMLVTDGTVIRNAGTSSLVVRNCYLRGETAEPTLPLEGSGMLVAGNVRATLAMENSENIYLNSTIISRNWSALSTDSALPPQEGQKPLSLYLYGSEAITIDGGYGAYSDNLCNLYSYGSHIQAAEIGIVSGNYGAVTIGAVEDGEQDPAVAAILTQEDRDKQLSKHLGSIIDGGRHALMVYSQDSPELSTRIAARGSILRTVLGLDKNISYEPQDQAYINHTKGSVILVKSTNAEIILNKCEVLPDAAGTGYLVQTVYSNDTGYMNDIPDGENYPGVSVSMKDMRVAGDIAHEDFQRDMQLNLVATALDGAVNEYDWQHWSRVAAEEGFTAYDPEVYYETHHGVKMALQQGSVWNVTGESHLSKLMVGADCQVNGTILIDGVEQPNAPGSVYEGAIIVIPLAPAVEEPAAEEMPAEEMPAEEMPAEEMPAEEMPVEEMPAEEMPAEETVFE